MVAPQLARGHLRLFDRLNDAIKWPPDGFSLWSDFVLPEIAAEVNNQILEKNKLKARDNNNEVTNFFANRKERKYFYWNFCVKREFL